MIEIHMMKRDIQGYLPVLQWVRIETFLDSLRCCTIKLAPNDPIALLEATSSSSIISAASMYAYGNWEEQKSINDWKTTNVNESNHQVNWSRTIKTT